MKQLELKAIKADIAALYKDLDKLVTLVDHIGQRIQILDAIILELIEEVNK